MKDSKTVIREEEEQQAHFDRIEKAIASETLAFLCCCAIFDIPYVENSLPKKGSAGPKWIEYKKRLRNKKMSELSFTDGVTDVLKLYGDSVDSDDIISIVQQERSRSPHLLELGTHTQVKNWGIGNEEEPFTKEDYNRLDDIFETYADRLVSAGGMDVMQEDTLRQVSIMRLKRDKLILAGDKDSTATAKQLDGMIKENLSAEQLRKADARPVEDVRIDSIIDALEKWGAVEDGKIMSFPDLTEFLLKQLGRLGGVPAHKYSQTLDAADYELWFIQNCMAQNEDLPKWNELPDNMRFPEEVAHEFSDTPSDDEKRAYEGIGIVRKANG